MARLTGQLPHRLAEMLVVAGIDESSGVKIKKDKLSEPQKGLQPHDTILEPQLLAALSSRLAIYPFREPPQDRKYPPMSDVAFVSNRKQSVTEKKSRFLFGRKDKSQSSLDRKTSIEETLENTPGRLTRRLSRRMSFIQTQDKVDGRAGGMLSVEAEELAVPYDVLSSLCGLCFPDDEKMSPFQLPSKIHHLVLTDMAGNRSHATCLTYWTPYSLHKSEKGDGTVWDCTRCSSEEVGSIDQTRGWLPACLVIISKFPYYTLFKDCLSKLYGKMSRMPKEQYFGLKEMALQLTMTPVPPAGQVNLSFQMDDTHFIVFPPESPYRPVVDLPLELIFTKFTPDQVQKLLLAVLTQQRIVFLSKVYCLHATIMETLLLLAQPFEWKLPYVPVLPKCILELLDAPGTFIMGCHASHKEIVSQIEGLVVADIDEGTVTLSNEVELPIMPVEPSSIFLAACEEFIHPTNQDLERLTFFKYEDMKAAEVRVRDLNNQKILGASLQLMVYLFRPLLPFVKVEQRFFKKDQFIESISEEFQPFYIQVLQTDLFGQFLKDRFANVKDDWTALEERTRPMFRRSIHSTSSEHDLYFSPQKRSSSVLSLSSSLPSSPTAMSPSALSLTMMAFSNEPVTIVLPVFSPPLHKLYYTKCIEAVYTVISDSKTNSVRASCLHLVAMLHFGNKKPLDALEHFSYILAYDSRIFPRSLVSNIMRDMTDQERQDLQLKQFYKQSDDLQHLLEDASAQRDWERERPIIMHIDKLPKHDLDLYSFAEKCQIHEIASDHETIKRLFEALAMGLSTQKVNSATFVSLYEGWKEIEVERRGCVHNVTLDEGEFLLQVSSIIKTSLGTGRLALTQKRLFFLVEGSKNSKNVARLTEIKDVDRISVSSFLSQAPGIRITYKDEHKAPFVATLKDQRDMWHMVIVEMWSGKLISDELRDISVIHQASQNVTLIDTLLRSGEEKRAQHHDLRTQSAEHMCYFTQRRLQGVDRLPDETKDILQRRVDPNLWEPSRSAIEALLYVPGNRSSNVDEYIGPKLWCGFGNGNIKVYNASTWEVDAKFVQAKDRIVCMITVANNQVWAGSLDSNIYVINIDTHTCYQTLTRHSAMVIDMVYIMEESYVASADVAGTVLIWNIETVQAVLTFSLPEVTVRSLHYHNSKLWCCCKDEIIAVDLHGNILHRINPSPGKKFSSPLDCFIITDKELWVGCGREGQILIWDSKSLETKDGITLQCQGISKMLLLQGRVWAATKDGMIFIINLNSHDTHRLLHAHNDAIRSICCAQTRYVLSGAGSRDGKIAMWKTDV